MASGLMSRSVRSIMIRTLPSGASGWQDCNVLTIDDFDTYPDFPVAGILFYDIGPVLRDPDLFSVACQDLTMVRKERKMPGDLLTATASIEYGAARWRSIRSRPSWSSRGEGPERAGGIREPTGPP
jgi:hypothetical protein